ncbi:MAG TPA: ABC transporter substrate-binding protein [Gaiellaceae bacterium]
MNRKLWRIGGLLVVAVSVAAIAAGCGGSSSSKSGTTSGSTSGGTIVDGTTDSVVNVDPAGNYDFGSATVDYQIFQHLLEAGPGNLTPHPVLATKCDFQGGLTTYECDLRKNVKFQNGSTMTSADVVWSFNRVNKIKDPSGIYTLLSNLKSVNAQGPDKVVFHLKAPQATWPQILTTGAAQIVPKNAYPADKIRPNTSPQYGTGPYQLTKFQPGQQAVFKKYDDYWGDPPKTANIIIRYYSKSSTMKLDLQNGNIDMAFRAFTPTELLSLKKDKNLIVHQGAGSEIRYLVLSATRAPTNQLAVRKAIAYLMPRQDIAQRIYHETVKPLFSMVPAGLEGHTEAFKTTYGASPDTAKAKAALQSAGISTPVKLTLWYTPTHYGDSSADEFAEIQRALQGSGLFTVTLKSAEWATYSNTLGKVYGAFQLGWFPDYVDAEDYLLPFYAASSNFTSNGYNNPQMNSLLAKAQGQTGSARIASIKQAQSIAAKDAPIIPYYQGNMIAVASPDVKGIDETLDPTFIMRFWLLSKS